MQAEIATTIIYNRKIFIILTLAFKYDLCKEINKVLIKQKPYLQTRTDKTFYVFEESCNLNPKLVRDFGKNYGT